jgi:phosphoribosyl 1,2-cyclic phosphate phosphodiesterase
MNRTFTFLGTGTSVGVPMIGCDCAVCTSDDPRNHRHRSGVLVTTPAGRFLIDTSPELRLQLLRVRVPFVHAVVYTHYHADHIFGLDDVRRFAHHLSGPLPLYCTVETEAVIRQAFSYAFAPEVEGAPPGMIPSLTFRRVGTEPFEVAGETVTPIPLTHGRFTCNGYRIGGVAFCTDTSEIPEASWPLLEGLDVLILDCLRRKPHPAHLSLGQALDVIERVRPGRALLTHLSHEFDHEQLRHELPAHVEPAYDGLSFDF